MDQPAGTVESAPHPVVGSPGPFVEGAEVMELEASEFLGRSLTGWVEKAAGVGAHLDQFHPLLGDRPIDGEDLFVELQPEQGSDHLRFAGACWDQVGKHAVEVFGPL